MQSTPPHISMQDPLPGGVNPHRLSIAAVLSSKQIKATSDDLFALEDGNLGNPYVIITCRIKL